MPVPDLGRPPRQATGLGTAVVRGCWVPIDVRAEERFVDDGDIITSSGVSAGIDMALHLVARLAGTDRAREVRRGIQYDPEPPV